MSNNQILLLALAIVDTLEERSNLSDEEKRTALEIAKAVHDKDSSKRAVQAREQKVEGR